jgi:hypothetical protein
VAAAVIATPLTFGSGVTSTAVRETAEAVTRKAAKTAAREGGEVLARQVEVLAARHGDDAVRAVQKAGPAAVKAIEEAGEYAGDAVRLLARHGDEALWITAKPGRLSLFAKYGDDGAKAMLRHREIATTLMEGFGQSGARAVAAVGGQNARRLAMLAESGELRRLGRAEEVLEVIGRYGDRAAQFVWANKGSLAVGAVLATFLADPKPYIDGVRELTKTAAENVAKPLAEVPAAVATEAAKGVNWNLIVVLGFLVLVAVAALRYLYGQRQRPLEPNEPRRTV